MISIDEKKLKPSLILGIIFFVLSHPYVYRLLHRNFSNVVAFLDADGCPSEMGVLVMAIVLVIIVYLGNEYILENTNNTQKNLNGNSNNVILNKCRTYCQQVSNEMDMANNITNQNNNKIPNNGNVNSNIRNVNVNNLTQGNTLNGNNVVAQMNNNLGLNNMAPPSMSNQVQNIAVANNTQMNQNRMNNAMMNNQLQNNVAQAPIPSVNLNNASNLGMDNLNNTGSSDMGLLNSQSCSDNPQCSGNPNSLVGGQVYSQNLSNYGQGGMFSENTTYHDDMYASLF